MAQHHQPRASPWQLRGSERNYRSNRAYINYSRE